MNSNSGMRWSCPGARASFGARLLGTTVIIVAVFAAAQLVRPGRANVGIDASRTIGAQMGGSSRLVAVLDRSCGDCHSNATVSRWYARVAPLSWLMARGVSEGRKVVNFSEWTTYRPDTQRALLEASCQAASNGKMPGPYAWVRPDTRLSTDDVQTICAAAMKAEADVARGR